MTQEIEPHLLERYQIHKKIGSGAYGHVWKVLDRQSKTIKALKKNFDAFSNSTDAQRTYRQIMFLRQLRHPNIINLERVIRAHNDKDIYLIFQHMDIDLHTLIREDGKSTQLQQRHKQYIIYQIAKAMFYLHHSNLIHRDIKPSNILVNQNCQAKLCDFGLVRFMEEPQDQELVVMTDYIATRWYRAPQLLLGTKDYNKEVDMWALGCLIGEMFNGKALFPGTSTVNQIERVVAWTGPPTTQDLKQLNLNLTHNVLQQLTSRKKLNRQQFIGSKVSPLCLDLISKLLQFNPSKRLTIQQVLKHDYLAQFYQQKQIKMIRSGRAKIQLHINDNTKISLKDYRQLIYNQIASKKKVLSSGSHLSNTAHTSTEHSKSKSKVSENKKKEIMSRDKSKNKTTAHQQSETKFQTFQSTHSREDGRFGRKDIRSSMDKSLKSRNQNRKKGISVCSKSASKHTSLSRKARDSQTTDSHQMCKGDVLKKTKINSRSCSEKYDKSRRTVTQEGFRSRKGMLLADCYVNNNIGRKMYQQEVK